MYQMNQYVNIMRLNQTDLLKIKNYFKDEPVKKAYLFGSHSRDSADDDSDIDILIELDYSQQIGLRFVKMQLDLQEILRTKVDLLSEKAMSKYIRPYIENDKELIYEK